MANFEPKFDVHDRVRVRDGFPHAGKGGKVVARFWTDTQGYRYHVAIPVSNFKSVLAYAESELEVVEP